MAVNRTVLPSGLVQSQHGLTGYEADQDANATLLDKNFFAHLLFPDLGINGVISGFTLSTSSTLTPGLTAGKLFAQGQRYAPAAAPTAPAMPVSSIKYLFYNSTTGLYYQDTSPGATAGDALIGLVQTNATQVNAVTQATTIFGQVSLAPSTPGNFSTAHLLGRKPVAFFIRMSSGGAIWQQALESDGTNLLLVASDSGITGKAIVW